MVRKGTSGGECYVTYESTSGTGSGAGYVNACIHSGSNDYTSGNTVWYNYATATAGTIKNSSASETTGPTAVATESICPKGWALPSKKQTDKQNTTSFSLALGGFYNNGTLSGESTRGIWWGSTAYNSSQRYYLTYNSNLYTDYGVRYGGAYIRCVSEEKDVSDLTYMQDMTPSILQELCVIVNVLRV